MLDIISIATLLFLLISTILNIVLDILFMPYSNSLEFNNCVNFMKTAIMESDIINTTVTDDGWVFETHSFGNRIYADGRLTVADFNYISTKKEVVVINLPFSVNYKTSSLIVSKITGTESGDSDASASEWNPYDLIEESFIEARFINANENMLSSQIEIALINPNADFVAEALNNMNMDVCIHIAGFTV